MNAPLARRSWRPRFRLATLFWLTLVAAVALAWRADRQRQEKMRIGELRAMRIQYDVRMAAIGSQLTGQHLRGAGSFTRFASAGPPSAGGGGMNATPPSGRPLSSLSIEGIERGVKLHYAWVLSHEGGVAATKPDSMHAGLVALELLEHGNRKERLQAASVLADGRQYRDDVLPVLIRTLQTGQNDHDLALAALAIGAYRQEASSVLPELEAQLAADVDSPISPALRVAIFLVKGDLTAEAPDLKLGEADLKMATLIVSRIEQQTPEVGLLFASQIATLLDSPDEYLCMAAARALARSSAPGEASKKLLAMFEQTTEPFRRGLLACLYLGQQQLDEEASGN